MKTRVCDMFGIDLPIFAFSHCRDVVAAVSKAGGLGVLGALAFSPEQLEIELNWIDEHVDGKPYGVDVVMPAKYAGAGELDPERMGEQLKEMIPQQHRDWVDQLLAEHDVPELSEEDRSEGLLGWVHEKGREQVQIALEHPIKLLANALGSPPKDVVDLAHEHGVKVAALCGSVQQAERHVNQGVDIIVAQGGEAGGHTGDVASLVLWPDVVDAVAPAPVLAAGGIGTGRQIAAALRSVAKACGPARSGSRRPRATPARWRWRSCSRQVPATRCGRAAGRASRRACCAPSGPRRGSARTRPARCRCRSSSCSSTTPCAGSTSST